MDPITWAVIGLAALVGWLAFSPDPLARVVRVRFQGQKAVVTKALDDAVARVDAGIADAQARKVKANRALIEIKTQRIAVQTEVEENRRNFDKYQAAAENAASVGQQALATEAVNRKRTAQKNLDRLEPQLELLKGKEAEVEKAVQTIEEQLVQFDQNRKEIQVRAKTAATTISVHELMTGIDVDGGQKDVERAFEIVAELEAKGGAMAEMGQRVTDRRAMDRELDALSQPAVSSVDAEVEELMAKYRVDRAAANLSA